ncbi:hypothetical protein U9M48_038269 [Paspalum notatum var. saurae]|uniref:Uncharacterized protein n=1 Tax=Paspalum notatum var. saurae TaxID=547442 RepID=A0AAQ3XBH2_PASNO
MPSPCIHTGTGDCLPRLSLGDCLVLLLSRSRISPFHRRSCSSPDLSRRQSCFSSNPDFSTQSQKKLEQPKKRPGLGPPESARLTVGSAPGPDQNRGRPSRPLNLAGPHSPSFLSSLTGDGCGGSLPRSSIPPPPPHTQLAAFSLLVVPAPAAASFTRCVGRGQICSPPIAVAVDRRLFLCLAPSRQPAAAPPPPPGPPPPPPFTLAAARSAAAGRRATSLPLASTRHALILYARN